MSDLITANGGILALATGTVASLLVGRLRGLLPTDLSRWIAALVISVALGVAETLTIYPLKGWDDVPVFVGGVYAASQVAWTFYKQLIRKE